MVARMTDPKSYERKYHGIVNLYHPDTLSGVMMMSFQRLATEYGLRIEGIEDDARNEHSLFWLAVAKDILARIP